MFEKFLYVPTFEKYRKKRILAHVYFILKKTIPLWIEDYI